MNTIEATTLYLCSSYISMKQFTIPSGYRSPLIGSIKQQRRQTDKMKKDFSPTLLPLGKLNIYLARHFGFCYGVEHAIEIAFRTVDENPGKRIFLLSEMIHNPLVNADLEARGVQFLQDTYGRELLPFSMLTAEDIVIIPAFGTTLAIEEKLHAIGANTQKYNTTCPFVEKVWNRSEQIASQGYTVIIHGKPTHEETRATFSHAAAGTAALVINDMQEAIVLGEYISGVRSGDDFKAVFSGRYSDGFDHQRDLQRIGVVNQTTMLASDTQAIADYLKQVMLQHYQPEQSAERFADTRDTLCYATNDNQAAVEAMLNTPADLAIVVGGYNSSNTSHLVELCETKLPTYFISDAEKMVSPNLIRHYDLHQKRERETTGFLTAGGAARILITSGASCPDTVVAAVIEKLAVFFNAGELLETVTASWQQN